MLVRDYGFSPVQQEEIWSRWRGGESFNAMGRALAAPMHQVRSFLAQTGGVRQAPQRRSRHHLTVTDREEISRGIAADESARCIAARLERSASTVSREIARDGAESTTAPSSQTRKPTGGPGDRSRRSSRSCPHCGPW